MARHDPFRELGIPSSASADDVRAARRRLAKEHHPDIVGGDTARMRRVNDAAAAALRTIAAAGGAARPTPEEPASRTDWSTTTTDVPSFTVEALPVETFEALLVVASWIGEVLDDDPPYRLDTHLFEPAPCWCRLELVPDAGASTVSLGIAAVGDGPPPSVESVRDVWIDQLNRYDWDDPAGAQ